MDWDMKYLRRIFFTGIFFYLGIIWRIIENLGGGWRIIENLGGGWRIIENLRAQ